MFGKKILIADDDRDLVRVLALRCSSLGMQVVTAYDALSALKQMESERPDIVCLDVQMPAGNGLSVCEMMAHHESLQSIPVMILTGRTDTEVMRRCHHLCAYFIPKCGSVWDRIEPLLRELLPETEAPASAADPNVSRPVLL